MGLRVQVSDVADMIGFADPDAGAVVLTPPAAPAAPLLPPSAPPAGSIPIALQAAFNAAATPAGDAVDVSIDAILADEGWEAMVAPLIAGLEPKLAAATSIEDATRILALHFQGMGVDALAEKLAQAAFSARLAGEADEPLTDKV